MFLVARVDADPAIRRLPVAIGRAIGHLLPLLLLGYTLWVVGLRLQGPRTTSGQVLVSYAHAGWWPVALVVGGPDVAR